MALRLTIRGRQLTLVRSVRLLRYLPRTLTFRPHGAKLRSLRRAVRRGAASATVRVTGPGRRAADAGTISLR